ncbi:hypothetical protein ml_402 [Mollivirus sibericum]|uniref:hypothetical protein n=1 Tax=Mollivirus sibericum TaxID=1678078 RepID=UPI0006B2E432|nr:hypothetical protein ml_402 [Mollivirus sibericum]ALD62204.1 hypothetical protein ml_402 [Mollivirus sibericum]
MDFHQSFDDPAWLESHGGRRGRGVAVISPFLDDARVPAINIPWIDSNDSLDISQITGGSIRSPTVPSPSRRRPSDSLDDIDGDVPWSTSGRTDHVERSRRDRYPSRPGRTPPTFRGNDTSEWRRGLEVEPRRRPSRPVSPTGQELQPGTRQGGGVSQTPLPPSVTESVVGRQAQPAWSGLNYVLLAVAIVAIMIALYAIVKGLFDSRSKTVTWMPQACMACGAPLSQG